MASFGKPKPPIWYTVVAVLLVAWNLMGCWACYLQFKLGAEAMGPATDYDRALFASLPGWYNYCYAVGVGAGLCGAVALLLKSAIARPLFALSLIAVVIQFGYLFATSDLIAHKGFMTVVPFPVFIACVCGFSLWLSGLAIRKRWIG